MVIQYKKIGTGGGDGKQKKREFRAKNMGWEINEKEEN